jgi:ferredoxin
MPIVTVEGAGSFEVPAGKRLVNALVDECGIDQLHACGGVARCTTCRVEFVSGEPARRTRAEQAVLEAKGLTAAGAGGSGIRLSCQIVCDQDMHLRATSRLAGSGRADAGRRPADGLQPEPVEWV